MMKKEANDSVNEFRSVLIEKGVYDEKRHSPYYLSRFLKARQGSIPKASEMFINCQEWRKTENVDQIHQFDFPELEKVLDVYPQSFHNVDKQGRLFHIARLHSFDLSSFLKVSSEDRIIRYHIREMEKTEKYRLPACSVKAGKEIDKIFMVLDLKDAPNLLQIHSSLSLLQKLLAIDNSNYPELLSKLIIINAGMIFTGIWRVVSNVLPRETVEKISILGSSYKAELLEHVDEDNLPSFFGGKCTCENVNGGCEMADKGPWNDASIEGYPLSKWEFVSERNTV